MTPIILAIPTAIIAIIFLVLWQVEAAKNGREQS